MTELINLLTQNGIGIVCVAYMIYLQNTTMKQMLNTLNSIDKRLSLIENQKRGNKNEE